MTGQGINGGQSFLPYVRFHQCPTGVICSPSGSLSDLLAVASFSGQLVASDADSMSIWVVLGLFDTQPLRNL
jgi:hypothetical protein